MPKIFGYLPFFLPKIIFFLHFPCTFVFALVFFKLIICLSATSERGLICCFFWYFNCIIYLLLLSKKFSCVFFIYVFFVNLRIFLIFFLCQSFGKNLSFKWWVIFVLLLCVIPPFFLYFHRINFFYREVIHQNFSHTHYKTKCLIL